LSYWDACRHCRPSDYFPIIAKSSRMLCKSSSCSISSSRISSTILAVTGSLPCTLSSRLWYTPMAQRSPLIFCSKTGLTA